MTRDFRAVDLAGKVAIVTGGTEVPGLRTARVLAAAGARVVLTARQADAGEAAADTIRQRHKGQVSVQQLDLSDLASVRAAGKALAQLPRIDILVLCAGASAASPLSRTKNGFEMQIGTNHFGHFALLQELLPTLKAQAFASRIVASTSSSQQSRPLNFDDLHYARRTYSPWGAFSQCSAASILMVKELAARLVGSRVSAFAVVQPASAKIRMRSSLQAHGHGTLGAAVSVLTSMPGVRSGHQGVATTVYAATSRDLLGYSGAYLADCQLKTPSKAARDLAQASQLWRITEAQLAAAEAPGGFKP